MNRWVTGRPRPRVWYRAGGSTVLGMPRPTADVAEVHGAHQRLHQTVLGLDDETMHQPSGLSGWSVGHVVSHLARNADSVVRRLQAARRGQRVEQYPGGATGRADEIGRSVARPATVIVADLIEADDRVDQTFAALPLAVWDQEVEAGGGTVVLASQLAFSRWREVEIHHVDLRLGYGATEWADAFVQRMLPRALDGLTGRCDPRLLLGWTLGRGAAPSLSPWG